MRFNWAEYLNLAKELAGEPRRKPALEAKLRAAISRAYYAVFHFAKGYLDDRNFLPGLKKDQHKAVISSFMHSKDENWREIGMSMDRLKEARRKVDYEAEFKRVDKKVTEVLTDSEAVIHKIRLLRN